LLREQGHRSRRALEQTSLNFVNNTKRPENPSRLGSNGLTEPIREPPTEAFPVKKIRTLQSRPHINKRQATSLRDTRRPGTGGRRFARCWGRPQARYCQRVRIPHRPFNCEAVAAFAYQPGKCSRPYHVVALRKHSSKLKSEHVRFN
jgi:hypothetical protein